jgi:hypothetical protein
LLGAFKGIDAVIPDAAAAAVPTIVESWERAALSAAEAAAVRSQIAKSNPSARLGEGNNSHLAIEITYPAH